MLKDYYEILNVPQDASLAEIKQQYQRLLLIHHPDKQQQNQSQQSGPASTFLLIPLQDIKEAWECLREPARRDFYDSSLKAMKLRANGQVNDDIDLDDMDYDEDTCSYISPCRCSGEYVISEDELELGVDTVVCSTCSLIVRIHYEVANDDE
ncbi:diphthamide biosynthesis protein 4 [Entomortierella parvispora]|uniref:Diphthamide biosynthesis protein 4 n=1 Tax=Entomortierella parvispora TaxID=205924 RepID=A0A9P3HFP2_9FUNG|nr:diphthamide biosynthesis protein 4 [Entomortierella parvispora]